jgi:hypothetical protein
VFLWLWLGHMYVESIGFHMHGPQSLIYGEALARRGLPLPPPDFSKCYRMRVNRVITPLR